MGKPKEVLCFIPHLNTPEVRLILCALPPDTIYDAIQQNLSPSWIVSFQEEDKKKCCYLFILVLCCQFDQ